MRLRFVNALLVSVGFCLTACPPSTVDPAPLPPDPDDEFGGIDCPTAVRLGAVDYYELAPAESVQWGLLVSCIDEHFDECLGYACPPSTEDYGSPAIPAECLQCMRRSCDIEIAYCLQPS